MPLISTFASASARGYGQFISAGNWWVGYAQSAYATSGGTDQAYGVADDAAGNMYVVGQMNGSISGTASFIMQLNPSGVVNWQRAIAPDGQSGAAFYGLGIDSSNNLYAGGTYNNGATANAYMVKYNSSGTIQWQKGWPSGVGTGGISGLNATADASGNAYWVGRFANASAGQNGSVVKLSTAGAFTWGRTLADTNAAASQNTWPQNIAVDGSGNVYVVGYFKNASGGTNAFIVKYNSAGTLQWQRSLADSNTAATQDTEAFSVGFDSALNVIVGGQWKPTSGGTYGDFVAKYNSSGVLQWQRFFYDSTTTYSGNIYGLWVSPTDDIYLTGRNRNSAGGSNIPLVKYNSSGVIQWQRLISDGNAAASQDGRGWALTGDNAGNLYLAGRMASNNPFRIALTDKLSQGGPRAGTFTIDGTHSQTITISTLTETAGTLTDAAGALTNATVTYTVATPTLTETAGALTTGKLAV